MAAVDLNNVQGDVFSRGFPKFNEIYYFFSITEDKESLFITNLKTLTKEPDRYISSLTKVLADWDRVDAAAAKNRKIEDPASREIISTSNALIAFTKGGLNAIQIGLADRKDLGLANLTLSDPTFDIGMANDSNEDGSSYLNDPDHTTWDRLFDIAPIHGLLKVAGDSPETVEKRLNEIKDIIGHGDAIADIPAMSEPTQVKSRVDGHVRPWQKKMNGREHFGFRDGISQPLLKGINSDAAIGGDQRMLTSQNIITVSKKPPGTQDGVKADPTKRPPWMIDGTFLAFRKLEQDVKGWNDFVKEKYSAAGCSSPEQLGAKLMGRWPSGAPISKYPDQDAPPNTKHFNDFTYEGVKKSVCPLGAHLRKVNPRIELDAIKNARLIRNGIPYGSEYDDRPNEKRGLLFACYQSSIENGFRFVQHHWSNRTTFPTSTTGHDPLIGQVNAGEKLHTTVHGPNEERLDPGLGDFNQTVTMKGGEYFFVPSISALRDTLGHD